MLKSVIALLIASVLLAGCIIAPAPYPRGWDDGPRPWHDHGWR